RVSAAGIHDGAQRPAADAGHAARRSLELQIHPDDQPGGRAYGTPAPQGGRAWRDSHDSQCSRSRVHPPHGGVNRAVLEHSAVRIPIRQPGFLRSTTFYMTLVVAGLFSIFIITLFGFIYGKIDRYLTRRSDSVITAQIDGIMGLPGYLRQQAVDER